MLSTITIWFQAQLAALRVHSERGAAAVEYGLLVALIAVAVIATVATLGGHLNTAFQSVVDTLQQYTPLGS